LASQRLPNLAENAYINIENVVASATLNQRIDLNAIVRLFWREVGKGCRVANQYCG
jgi:TATA-box binding protein (TBP) (component of TFIID and TFIIIB)